MQHGQRINNAYNDDHLNQRGELLQTQNELLEELTSDIQKMKSDIDDIRCVSDIFYKYKMPSKEERDILDQVELDNKFSDYVKN